MDVSAVNEKLSDAISPMPLRSDLPETTFALLYDELRRIARIHLAREQPGHTLQPTALVHEAFMRMIDQHALDWSNRQQALSLASTMMRRILVNHAEARLADKRGGGALRVTLSAADEVGAPECEIVELDEALRDLAVLDPRQAQIVELRYFGGLSVEETASALDLSPATVKRELATARLWLKQALQ